MVKKKFTFFKAVELFSVLHWVASSIFVLVIAWQKWNLKIFIYIIPLFLVGHFLADVLSGFVHFMGDTYGSKNTPIIGKRLVVPFRLHHTKPKAMCIHPFLSTVGNSSLLNIIPHTIFAYVAFMASSDLLLTLSVLYTLLASSTILGNLFHKWSHSDEANDSKIILFLQSTRLILNPKHHKFHHTNPFDTYYCIVNGWANKLLHKIKFWKFLVHFFALFGLKPDSSSEIKL